MVEIEMGGEFVRLLAYPETVYQFIDRSGISVVVDVFDEPQLPSFQALEAANGGDAKFRVDGKEVMCAVDLESTPRFAVKKMLHRRAHLAERLRPKE